MNPYLRPQTLDQALRALASGPHHILAGGTDFYPARVGRPVEGRLLDITAIADLRVVREEAGHWRIGAAATWSDLLAAPLPPAFEALRLAAREVGGMQIQNAGTVCGNVCNASPAADGIPALLALDAAVEIRGPEGVRCVPVESFVQGPRRVDLGSGELVTALLLPAPGGGARSHFVKLGARRYLVISIVMAAGTLTLDGDGRIAMARLAIGACSPVARRLRGLEDELRGRPAVPGIGATVTATHLACLAPIDDVRASAAYRLEAARSLTARLLETLVETGA